MYKRLIRPVLFFLFSPECIHRLVVGGLRAMKYVPGLRALLRRIYTVKDPSLEREVMGINFRNPVGLAAGFDKNATVYNEMSCLGFGFVEVGTVTPKAQPGNPRPRLFRLPKDKAIINRMGFNNQGIDAAVKRLSGRKHKLVVGGNLGKNTMTSNEHAPTDYLRVFRALYQYVDYFVVNVSCPNICNMAKLQTRDSLEKILKGLLDFRKGQDVYTPILLKISPDLSMEQIDQTLEVIKEFRIDGVVAVNTTTRRDGLVTDAEQIERIGNGGLSGRPLTHRTIEIVRHVREKTGPDYPIIGVGGVMSEDDAVAMLRAGASLIQIYSGFIYEGPGFARRICKRLVREAHAG